MYILVLISTTELVFKAINVKLCMVNTCTITFRLFATNRKFINSLFLNTKSARICRIILSVFVVFFSFSVDLQLFFVIYMHFILNSMVSACTCLNRNKVKAA